ncbi:MAG: hypothetical protein ACI814_000948 [Mariniblastus sp.]|jgi:hypothetical protein
MDLKTVIRFLFFDARAIKRIANSSAATWVGLLFVVAAGFAREYDGEYLGAQPWHLAIPVGASLLACFTMVIFIYNIIWLRNRKTASPPAPFKRVFRSLLNVFWMTAPLAFLYAIPFERFLDAGDATQANLSLLGLVAAWRVALMVRSVQVLFNVHLGAAFIPVILFSDVVAMAAIWLIPSPVFLIMGGIRLTDSQQIILSVRLWLILIGYGTFLIWLIAYFVLCSRSKPWNLDQLADEEPAPAGISIPLRVVVAASLLIWIAVLPATQKEQWLRWKSSSLILSGDYDAASQLTREHPETSFPPHWSPPPRLGWGDREPSVYEAINGLKSHQAAPWMLARYFEKLDQMASSPWWRDSIHQMDDEALVKAIDAIEACPNSRKIANDLAKSMAYSINRILNPDGTQDMVSQDDSGEPSESRVASIKRLMQIAEPTPN